MDFVVGLPKVGKNQSSCWLLIIFKNMLSFYPLAYPFTPSSVSQVFMDHIFKLHGMPTSIFLDQDPTFTKKIWQELFKLQGMQLNMGIAYHPEIDGQT